jgi:Tfp pilus tip-associated adhesin PilY1
MKIGKRGFARRFTASLVLALFMSQVSLPVWGTGMAWADVGTNVKAPLKDDVGMEETDDMTGGARKSNVLFLIESTAAMSFTPKGVVPQVRKFNDWDWSSNENANWQLTKEDYGFTIYDINRMMADATFGMGAMPPAWTNRDLRPERNLYGRERVDANNFVKGATFEETMKLNADNYYFPFLSADNPISNGLYAGQTTGLEVGFENNPEVWPYSTVERSTAFDSSGRAGYPTNDDYGHWDGASAVWYYDTKGSAGDKGYYKSIKPTNNNGSRPAETVAQANLHVRATAAGYGDQIIAPYEYKNNTSAKDAYPYAMVFKNPANWKSLPESWTSDDLVPNDSRMYQTKLFLWRLLSDPDLFKNIRFGMATTFLSPSNVEIGHMTGTHRGVINARQDYNGIFKVAPFGGNVWTIAFFDQDGKAYINIDANIKNAIKDGKFQNGFRRVKFSNGILSGATTGNMETNYSMFGQYYPMWMNAKVQSYYDTAKVAGNPANAAQEEDGWKSSMGVATDGNLYRAGQNRDRPLYKLMNRASLWLPIESHDYKWTKGGKTISQIDKFKLWINGVADIKSAGSSTPSNFNTGGWHWGDQYDRADSFTGNRLSQFYYYNDPEIGIAGNFALAQAIFPDPTKYHPKKTNVPLQLDRDFYYNEGYVWFAKKDKPMTYKIDKRRYSQEQDWSGKPRAYFNPGTGEATGSVMDFFSPKLGYSRRGDVDQGLGTYANESYDNLNFSDGTSNRATIKTPTSNISDGDLADVSFPITNTCEDSWVVVVSSGCEPNVKNGDYEYPVWQAVKNLYDATNAATSQDYRTDTATRKAIYSGVTMRDKNTGKLTTIDLENPIRTLVIGIVADPEKMKQDDSTLTDNDPVIKEVKRMRLNLIRMANAGQGVNKDDIAAITVENMYDAPFQPYFASNSAELLESFRNALIAVNKSEVTQPGKGALVETPPADEGDLPYMFSTSYRIVQGDQWDGQLTRYRVSDDLDGTSTLREEEWELDDNLRARRGTTGAMNRQIKYWNTTADNFTLINEGDAAFNNLLGANSRIGASNLPGETFGSVTPDKALYYWLQGYDYSYSRSAKYPRSSMLADFGNSGIVYADYPSVTNNGLPGYIGWAENLKSTVTPGTERLYAQTNDGILHVIVPYGTSFDRLEESAILPPPTLLPSRLASLKTSAGGEKLSWLDVRGDEKTLGTRSNPGFMLDGPLQKRRFGLSNGADGMAGTDWRTLLLGTLGRGGNGLYMLDITYPNLPKFLWYKENLGGSVASMAADQSEPVVTVMPVTDPNYSYNKLGFNSPKPAMGIAGTMDGIQRNFIALPGGSQSSYDPAQNGKEGAVLILIDPKNGEVIRAFDSAAVGSPTTTAKTGSGPDGLAPYMGMMVSQPTLLRSRSNSYITGRIFAEDNRGNIFMVSMEEQGNDGATQTLDKDFWKIRTVATLQQNLSVANSSPSSYAMPYGLSAAYDNASKRIWLGGGTSNVMTKKSPAAPIGEIENDFQMIFGLRVPDDQNNAITLVRDDLKEFAIPSEDKLEPSETYPGWFFKLRSEMQNDGEEYVSAKPVMVNGVMFIATFRETQKIDTSNSDPCGITRSVGGEARIYAVDIRTGAAGHWTGGVKWITIDDVKVVDISVRNVRGKTQVWFRMDNFTGKHRPGPRNGEAKWNSVDDEKATTDMDNGGSGGSGVPPETTIIQYWIMK